MLAPGWHFGWRYWPERLQVAQAFSQHSGLREVMLLT